MLNPNPSSKNKFYACLSLLFWKRQMIIMLNAIYWAAYHTSGNVLNILSKLHQNKTE